jgi:host factor-I protein
VNRKLIRTTLAEVKEREQQQQATRQSAPPQPAAHQVGGGSAASAAAQQRKRVPPEQTNAESFYYKKQMDSRTPMIIVLQDGEEIRGTIEWYDKGSLKLHRLDGPNLLILKHNIKYLYKDQDAKDE